MTERPPLDAYTALHDAIVRGTLAPGARVSEAGLAARLGVSRTPVRDAMRRLEAEGLLVITGGGARPRVAVAPLDAAEARELYAHVGLVEGHAARTAAEWPGERRRALAARMADADAAFTAEAARRGPRAERLFALHDAFHHALREATAGPVAAALLALLAPRLARYQWFQGPLVLRAGRDFGETYAEHAAIVTAVSGGSAGAIEQAVRDNWRNAAERFAAALAAAGAGAQATPGGARRPR